MTPVATRTLKALLLATVCIAIPLALFIISWNDLANNSGELFKGFETNFLFGAVFLLVIALLVLQLYPIVEFANIISEFGLLVGTLLMIPVIVAAFAYAYLNIPVSEFSTDEKSGEPIVICQKSHTSQCLYFSAVTFTTLGYGDIQPTGPARAYAISEAFLGFSFVPLLLGQLLNFFADLKRALYLQQIKKISEQDRKVEKNEADGIRVRELAQEGIDRNRVVQPLREEKKRQEVQAKKTEID